MRGFRPILLLVPALVGVALLVFSRPSAETGMEDPVGPEPQEEGVEAAPPIREDPLFDSAQPSPASNTLGRQTFIPPQAEPIIELLRAVEQRNLAVLPSLYAPDIRIRIEEKGWAHHAEELEMVMYHYFGTMDPDVLTFVYRGEVEEGEVEILFPGGKRGESKVVLLDGRWVLNER